MIRLGVLVWACFAGHPVVAVAMAVSIMIEAIVLAIKLRVG